MPPVPKPPPPTAKSGRNRKLLIALGLAAVVVVALVAASLLRSSGDAGDSGATTSTETTATATATATADSTTTDNTDPALALVAGIPQKGTVLGSADATVRMLQFEDLQCPICKNYTDNAFSAVVNEYVRTGRVKIDFRGLAFLGSDSLKALKIAMAAGLQDRLWQVVGLFYENQGAENSGWVTDSLIDQILADVPGLDAAKVKVDAQKATITNRIAAIQTEATKLGVPGTPWFYIGRGIGQPVEFRPGSFAPSEFRTALDHALGR